MRMSLPGNSSAIKYFVPGRTAKSQTDINIPASKTTIPGHFAEAQGKLWAVYPRNVGRSWNYLCFHGTNVTLGLCKWPLCECIGASRVELYDGKQVFVSVSVWFFHSRFHNSTESVEMCSKAPPFRADTRCKALLPITQRLKPRMHSSPSPRRFRLERETVTICEHHPLYRVPSPRVKRAASGLKNDTADACWGSNAFFAL